MDLITALYDGPFEEPLWQSFLDHLRALTQSGYASIIFRPLDGTPGKLIELYAGQASPPHIKQLYSEELYKRDPLPYHRYVDDKVYTTKSLLNPDDPIHRAFLKDLLIPSGMACMRTMRVTENSGVSAWLSIARSGPDYSKRDSELIANIAPHLRRALRNFVAIEREQFKATLATNAIQRLNFGWIAVDTQGHIIEHDQNAQLILQHFSVVRQNQSRKLSSSDRNIDETLHNILRSFAEDPGSRPHALTISRDPWINMLLVPVQDRQISSNKTPTAIAYVHADTLSTSDRHEQIVDLFGLLPSEARLALALSRGLTLAESAESLGITIASARNYSKKIFAKMGARGQSDLIRFILTSTLALA